MPMLAEIPARKTAGQTRDNRSTILAVATEEFARKGYAGARTDSIAQAAGTNPAMIFYYFRSKERLYEAVLDNAFSAWSERASRALLQKMSPRERLLAFVASCFDFIAEFPLVPRLVQQAHLGGACAGAVQRPNLAGKYTRPIRRKLARLLRDGISLGEFRQVDIEHCIDSITALILFYFTARVRFQAKRAQPCTRSEILERRAAVLDFVAAALFTPQSGLAVSMQCSQHPGNHF